MSYEREARVAREAADAAAEVIRRHCSTAREHWDKAEDSPVTQADLEANQAILDVLRREFPDDVILSEETRDSKDRLEADRVWIVDPLDGTKEFIARIPEFAVSIALAVCGQPVVGVVHEPLTPECFWGCQGAGAFLGNERLAVSRCSSLAHARVLTSRTEMKRGQVDGFRDWVGELKPVGSVALKLAYVAAGRGDLWISAAPKSEWDVCGGDLLVREAGGSFISIERGERVYNQSDVLLQPLMAAGPRPLVAAFRERSGGRPS